MRSEKDHIAKMQLATLFVFLFALTSCSAFTASVHATARGVKLANSQASTQLQMGLFDMFGPKKTATGL